MAANSLKSLRIFFYRTFCSFVCGFMISFCLNNKFQKRGVVLAVSLIALAIWDTILLWCAFLYYAIRKLPIAINSDWLNILMPWFHPFSQIANTAATWCVVAITWQRFMATRDPFRTPRSKALVRSFRSERQVSFMYCSTYRRLLRMPIALSIGAILLNVPAFFELYNYLCYKQEENRIAISVRPTALRLQSAYALYRLISRMIVVSIGPNLGILILTLLTVFMLRGSNRTRRKLFQMNENFLDRNASRSLTFVLDLVEVTVGVHNYYLVDVSNFLVLLNSATNSLVFLKASSWMNKRFLEKKTMTRKKTLCDAG
uniref:G_PROTEIN_RECEP_F1_2 domain-containing protein n=1 Tax=Angiostrongylus cantonensis TaxID=6313 RepID=A0A0K0DE22_ANGCA